MGLFEILHNTYVGMNCSIVSNGGIITKKKMIENSVVGSGRELS
jgi:hypothetical protein